jgi:hypothetical protein
MNWKYFMDVDIGIHSRSAIVKKGLTYGTAEEEVGDLPINYYFAANAKYSDKYASSQGERGLLQR